MFRQRAMTNMRTGHGASWLNALLGLRGQVVPTRSGTSAVTRCTFKISEHDSRIEHPLCLEVVEESEFQCGRGLVSSIDEHRGLHRDLTNATDHSSITPAVRAASSSKQVLAFLLQVLRVCQGLLPNMLEEHSWQYKDVGTQ